MADVVGGEVGCGVRGDMGGVPVGVAVVELLRDRGELMTSMLRSLRFMLLVEL